MIQCWSCCLLCPEYFVNGKLCHLENHLFKESHKVLNGLGLSQVVYSIKEEFNKFSFIVEIPNES